MSTELFDRLLKVDRVLRDATVQVDWVKHITGITTYKLRGRTERAVKLQINDMVKRAAQAGRTATFTPIYPLIPGGFGAQGKETARCSK